MLHFFKGPALGSVLKLRVIRENTAQILGIDAAIVLDHGSSFDDPEHVRIDLGRVKTVPGNIVQSPVFVAIFGHGPSINENGLHPLRFKPLYIVRCHLRSKPDLDRRKKLTD